MITRLIAAMAVGAAVLAQSPAHAQYFEDPYLYYSVGGGQAAARTTIDPSVRFRFNAATSGFSCGNFNPKLDIQSMLGGVGNSLADIGSLRSVVTGGLPGQILCRAKPSLCQLLQHYSVRAEDAWRFSVDACEIMTSSAAGGGDTPQDWNAARRAQEWARQQRSGADAVRAHREVSEKDNPCITWVEGVEAGCEGRPAVRPVRDAVRAGWCAANGLPADCERTSGARDSVIADWESPAQAGDYVADIIGDTEITGADTPRTHPATGLQPKVDAEMEIVLGTLREVIDGDGYPDQEQARILSSPSVSVTFQVINALREVDQHGIYAERLAQEIAVARTVERALAARRLLLTGASEPYIQSTGPAMTTIQDKVVSLDSEIDRLIFDYRIRRSLVTDTSIDLLNAYQRARTPTVIPRDIVPTRQLE